MVDHHYLSWDRPTPGKESVAIALGRVGCHDRSIESRRVCTVHDHADRTLASSRHDIVSVHGYITPYARYGTVSRIHSCTHSL